MNLLAKLRSNRTGFNFKKHSRDLEARRTIESAAAAVIEALECRQLLSSVVVNSLLDNVNDSNITGNTVTLREAVNYENANGGGSITFAPGLNGTITLSGTQLELSDSTGSITIDGPAANTLSISGNNVSGVFQIDSGTTAEIDGLTITAGLADAGGGINNN